MYLVIFLNSIKYYILGLCLATFIRVKINLIIYECYLCNFFEFNVII